MAASVSSGQPSKYMIAQAEKTHYKVGSVTMYHGTKPGLEKNLGFLGKFLGF